jgi:hypothetical protein
MTPQRPLDLIRGEDVRQLPTEQTATERIGGGDFVADIFGVHRDGEAAHIQQTVAALFRRWSLDRPGENPGGGDVTWLDSNALGSKPSQPFLNLCFPFSVAPSAVFANCFTKIP